MEELKDISLEKRQSKKLEARILLQMSKSFVSGLISRSSSKRLKDRKNKNARKVKNAEEVETIELKKKTQPFPNAV